MRTFKCQYIFANTTFFDKYYLLNIFTNKSLIVSYNFKKKFGFAFDCTFL